MTLAKPKQLPSRHIQIAMTLQKAEQAGTLHHGYLLYGAPGNGKRWIVDLFLEKIERNNPSDPDVMIMEGVQNTSIEAMRSFTTSFHSSSLTGKPKIAFIFDVDSLTMQAQNALLKTLEEPPQSHYLFLTSSNVYRVPETIRSRCIQLFVPRIPKHQCDQWLSALRIHPDRRKIALRASYGNIRSAYEISNQGDSPLQTADAEVEELLRIPSHIFSQLRDLPSKEHKELIDHKRHAWINALRNKLWEPPTDTSRHVISRILQQLINVDIGKSTNLTLQIENIWLH